MGRCPIAMVDGTRVGMVVAFGVDVVGVILCAHQIGDRAVVTGNGDGSNVTRRQVTRGHNCHEMAGGSFLGPSFEFWSSLILEGKDIVAQLVRDCLSMSDDECKLACLWVLVVELFAPAVPGSGIDVVDDGSEDDQSIRAIAFEKVVSSLLREQVADNALVANFQGKKLHKIVALIGQGTQDSVRDLPMDAEGVEK